MVKGGKQKNMQVVILKCKRCGHEWVQRISKRPKQCPGCHSLVWDKERTAKKDGK